MAYSRNGETVLLFEFKQLLKPPDKGYNYGEEIQKNSRKCRIVFKDYAVNRIRKVGEQGGYAALLLSLNEK